ncbi:nuclear valosin-containing protein-like [Amphiura filiformis]|uniref:nuclear valosin-containing protein-like n=1 Tax=Amphiura filiformis TaxID=82378 RepID=UPI003B220CFB
MKPKPPGKSSGGTPGQSRRQSGVGNGNRTPYFGDRQLARRVEEYLKDLPNDQFIDAESVADNLQLQYRDYARRKRNAFRKSVQKVCDWYSTDKQQQKKSDRDLQTIERKHLAKKRKRNKYNVEDFSSDSFDSDEDSFSSDNPDYVEVKDTNMANNMLSNLYMKTPGSMTNTPASSPGQPLSKASRSASYPGSPKKNEDSDNESLQLGNITMEITSDVEEAAARKLREQSLVTNSSASGKQKSDIEETPSTKKKSKRRKTVDQIIEDKILEGDGSKSTGKVTGLKSGQRKRKRVEPTLPNATFADVGGNDDSLHEVCKLLVHMRHPEVYQQLGVTPPRGVLLHGPPGCGKTLLAHAIAGELDLPFIKIAATEIVSGVSGESEGNIRDVFEQALALAPCILFIDEIDAITPKRETAQREMERRIVAQLLSCMDDLNSSACHALVIGATNRVDALDPALRRAGRFDREICMGIPDEKARERIMAVLCRNLRLAAEFSFHHLASLTPGYVGADLMALCREAAMCAVNRIFYKLQTEKGIIKENSDVNDATDNRVQEESIQPEMQTVPTNEVDSTSGTNPSSSSMTDAHHHPHGDGGSNLMTSDTTALVSSSPDRPSYITVLTWLKEQPPLSEEELQDLRIEMADFEQALPLVQPSAKREGFATIPDVTWDDVGALEGVRDDLTMAILAPVRNPDAFKALGLTSPPGILLAGPPGCGKTLLAKAIANESGINFISVKGPELMNMYVGESERAVRQCFQRARNSAPCVIFFDELDALCPRRSDYGESGSSARVVNQLLTEMDGLEARKQVFIMGATNRPDIIDPAVLRPGRMDKILYVGIPPPQDRVAILKTITRNGTRPRIASDISIDEIGMDGRCLGYTGADLAALVREASMNALKKIINTMTTSPTQKIDMTSVMVMKEDFEAAFLKVKASVSKKDQLMYERMRVNLLRGQEEEKKPETKQEEEKKPKTQQEEDKKTPDT